MWPRGPEKRYTFNRHAGFYGFWMSLARSNVAHSTGNPQPAPGDGNARTAGAATRTSFNYMRLAVELAAAALAGHAEHRLTT